MKAKFGEKEAEEFVALIKEEVNSSLEIIKDSLATKNDINKLNSKLVQNGIKAGIKDVANGNTNRKNRKPFNPLGIYFLGNAIGRYVGFLKVFIK